MTDTTTLAPLAEDEWFVDHPDFQQFVTIAREISNSTTHKRTETLRQLEPYFMELLNKQNWLPEQFTQPNPDSHMGGGIGQWLLYRSKERSLSIFSLVIPPSSTTPIHDHLAWGLVGLYRGKQEETVYRRVDNDIAKGYAELEIAEVRQLKRGDIYRLLPPDGDIHAVATTTVFTSSVSIHVLGNDTGCVWRHQYNHEVRSVRSFRSGYSNASCKE